MSSPSSSSSSALLLRSDPLQLQLQLQQKAIINSSRGGDDNTTFTITTTTTSTTTTNPSKPRTDTATTCELDDIENYHHGVDSLSSYDTQDSSISGPPTITVVTTAAATTTTAACNNDIISSDSPSSLSSVLSEGTPVKVTNRDTATLLSDCQEEPRLFINQPQTSKIEKKKKKKKSLWKKLTPRFLKTKSSENEKKKKNTMSITGPPFNVLQWLEVQCVDVLVAHVLSFLSPQLIYRLMQVNRYWYHLIAHNDATWRTLSEGMYKWKEGRDELPTISWKEYYCLHPTVPTDYFSIASALAAASEDSNSSHNNSKKQKKSMVLSRNGFLGLPTVTPSNSSRKSSQHEQKQVRSIRILLRPGRHVVEESLVVDSVDETVTVALETIQLPENRFYSPRLAFFEQQQVQSSPSLSTMLRRRSNNSSGKALRQMMMQGCRSVRGAVDGMDRPLEREIESIPVTTAAEQEEENDNNIIGHHAFYDSIRISNDGGGSSSNSRNHPASMHRAQSVSSVMIRQRQHYSHPPPAYPTRARLMMKTRSLDEPILRVRRGHLQLCRVDLEHASYGTNIWNGNAAVHIEPPKPVRNQQPQSFVDTIRRPSAELANVSVSSKTGRGVVCLDGGMVALKDSMVFDCAATGLYVGGRGSEASMERSDIVRNGIGNSQWYSFDRVSPGHSGVYLEQGTASIRESNISGNTLTGISAIAHGNAVLKLEHSALVANGHVNLEHPPPGTIAFRESHIANNNYLSTVGRPTLRSNLELPTRTRLRTSIG